MALRIPERKDADRVSLPVALRRLVELESTLDPTAVMVALLEAVKHGDLDVSNVPEFELGLWRDDPQIDWSAGYFCLDGPAVPVTLKRLHTPIVSFVQVIAIFEEKEDAAKPISIASLRSFLDGLPGDFLKENDARNSANHHFEKHSISDETWRAVWKTFPRKRRRGQTDRALSTNKPPQ